MKLSEINGKRQMAVLADVLELAEFLSGRPELDEFFKTARESKDGQNTLAALCKLSPLLRDGDVQDKLVAIVASAKGISLDEAEQCNIVAEIVELLTSESDMLDFFGSAERSQE